MFTNYPAVKLVRAVRKKVIRKKNKMKLCPQIFTSRVAIKQVFSIRGEKSNGVEMYKSEIARAFLFFLVSNMQICEVLAVVFFVVA